MHGDARQARGYTIGELARGAGISVETVRFYERRGLLAQPGRPARGIRRYDERSARRLQFIRHAKTLGFTLKEIGDMLSLAADGPSPCAEVQRLAEDKLVLLRVKRASLRFMEAALEDLLETCRRQVDRTHCPVLEAADEGGAPLSPRRR